uniref:Uncharacterized protein n=1 Tax=Rhodosorus marinus TaxID=101924 RepID=A0A7S3EI14_9RHOD|mmetsp:Transcript_35574/g.141913  ORF Transcript_35574/g.141913 Transcript_35574/m.141913 type:complete len:131 (+) Transcript_35574:175-567(+)
MADYEEMRAKLGRKLVDQYEEAEGFLREGSETEKAVDLLESALKETSESFPESIKVCGSAPGPGFPCQSSPYLSPSFIRATNRALRTCDLVVGLNRRALLMQSSSYPMERLYFKRFGNRRQKTPCSDRKY